MRLLIDDTFATSTYTVPCVSGWVKPPDEIRVELVRGLLPQQIAPGDVALAPSSVIGQLQQSHQVVPTIAVIAAGTGAVALRTPVRPDEVEATPVRLFDAPGAELLARAVLQPFYGIEATAWIHDGDTPQASLAQAVIVEGAEALREPEAGFSEDLNRAWFILTALPVVSHLLLLPPELPPAARQEIVALLDEARVEGLARRREWRPKLADREGIARDRAGAFWGAQRLEMVDADREALRELLTRGSRGGFAPITTSVPFVDGAEDT